MSTPRFLLTAGASGSGKTLITCGILQAFQDRGRKVASFKCGPDYIDPMFHTRVIEQNPGIWTPFLQMVILHVICWKETAETVIWL